MLGLRNTKIKITKHACVGKEIAHVALLIVIKVMRQDKSKSLILLVREFETTFDGDPCVHAQRFLP